MPRQQFFPSYSYVVVIDLARHGRAGRESTVGVKNRNKNENKAENRGRRALKPPNSVAFGAFQHSNWTGALLSHEAASCASAHRHVADSGPSASRINPQRHLMYSAAWDGIIVAGDVVLMRIPADPRVKRTLFDKSRRVPGSMPAVGVCSADGALRYLAALGAVVVI